MAAKKGGSSRADRNSQYRLFHRFIAGLSLVCFFVVVVSGMQADAGVVTISFRSLVVILSIAFLSRMLIRMWTSIEEMNRG